MRVGAERRTGQLSTTSPQDQRASRAAAGMPAALSCGADLGPGTARAGSCSSSSSSSFVMNEDEAGPSSVDSRMSPSPPLHVCSLRHEPGAPASTRRRTGGPPRSAGSTRAARAGTRRRGWRWGRGARAPRSRSAWAWAPGSVLRLTRRASQSRRWFRMVYLCTSWRCGRGHCIARR
jgi:hypothetical protein